MSYYASTILANKPKAYYRMSATSGAVEHDVSGNGYDAMLTGVVAYNQAGALVNDSDPSIRFTSSGGILVPYTLDYTTFSAFSLELWSDASGSWQYVAVTCDGSTTIIYINGNVDTPGAGAPIVISSFFDFAGSSIASRLDEVAVYDYVLLPIQIINDYNAAFATLIPVYTIRRDNLISATRRDNLVTTARRDNITSTTRRDNQATATRRDNQVAATRRDNVVATTRRG